MIYPNRTRFCLIAVVTLGFWASIGCTGPVSTVTISPFPYRTGIARLEPTSIPTLPSEPALVGAPILSAAGGVTASLPFACGQVTRDCFGVAFTTVPPNGLYTQIYRLTSDGHSVQRLTDTSQPVYAVVASPDGRRIAFNYDPHFPTKRNIYLLEAATGTVVELAQIGTPDDWSPDASRIAYHSWWEDGYSRLYLVGADGSDRQRLFLPTDADRDAGSVSWSPDGQFLVYSAGPPYVKIRRGDPITETQDIFIVDLVTLETRQITTEEQHGKCFAPDWSPDGQWIAMMCRKPDADFGGVYAIHPDGSGWRQVTPSSPLQVRWLHWSPDGRQILYLARMMGEPWQIYSIDADGKNNRQLTSFSSSVLAFSVFRLP